MYTCIPFSFILFPSVSPIFSFLFWDATIGVKHHWDILESCKKALPLHHLQNQTLCVDLSCWLIHSRTPTSLRVASRTSST
ncbi:putative PIN-like domain superfamily protein [Dioscorea sansibarensis]